MTKLYKEIESIADYARFKYLVEAENSNEGSEIKLGSESLDITSES